MNYNDMIDYNLLSTRQQNKEKEAHRRRQEDNATQKRLLISEAQTLQYSEDWKNTSAQMKELMNRWKAIGNAGTDNDLLWSEFQNARQTFYDRQNKYFEQLNHFREQKKQQKLALIAEAQNAVQYVTDWKGTHEHLQEILSRWKQIGSAGKEDDDVLWTEFQRVRDDFYARKKIIDQNRESEFLNRRQAKSNLILEAEAYARSFDYSTAAADRMRSLNTEWKNIGFCGKGYEDQLWSQFRMAQDSYWQGKKSSGEKKHQEWRYKIQEAINRRKTRIGNIQRNIDNLKDRLNTTHDYSKQNQIFSWISENEAQIRDIEAEIYHMERELM